MVPFASINYLRAGRVMTSLRINLYDESMSSRCGYCRVIGTPCQRSDGHESRTVKRSAVYCPYRERYTVLACALTFIVIGRYHCCQQRHSAIQRQSVDYS